MHPGTVLLIGWLLPTTALAGNVVLIADQPWSLVEVREGTFLSSDQNPVVFGPGPVQAGTVHTGSEGTMVCYRRENQPGDASSGLMTSAVCTSNAISGTEELHIQ
jgi:hypothetical protein